MSSSRSTTSSSPSPSSTSDGSKTPLRVLCLHGLTENAGVMRRKLDSTMERLANEEIEFVFMSAPYMLPKINKLKTAQGELTLKANNSKSAKDQEEEALHLKASFAISYGRALQHAQYAEERREKNHWDATRLQKLQEKYSSLMDQLDSATRAKVEAEVYDLQSEAKRWWTVPDEAKEDGLFIGHEASFALISQVMREKGPFDGFIGFSTGAMMGVICQALLQGSTSRTSEPTFQPPPEQKPFKFAIYFAPWMVYAGPYAQTMKDLKEDIDSHTPSLCFEGVKDRVLMSGSSATFAKCIRPERYELHNGGHSIPFWDEYPAFLSEWLSLAAKESRGLLGKMEATSLRSRLASPYKEKRESKPQEHARL